MSSIGHVKLVAGSIQFPDGYDDAFAEDVVVSQEKKGREPFVVVWLCSTSVGLVLFFIMMMAFNSCEVPEGLQQFISALFIVSLVMSVMGVISSLINLLSGAAKLRSLGMVVVFLGAGGIALFLLVSTVSYAGILCGPTWFRSDGVLN